MRINILRYLLALTIVFSSSTAFSKVLHPKSFLKKWIASPKKTHTQNKKIVMKSKVFKRFVATAGNIYEVATITDGQVLVKDNLPSNLLEQMEKAFGGKNWIKKKQNKKWILEGKWIGGNRYLRYFIHLDNGVLTTIMSTMRDGYKDSTLAEVKWIQNTLYNGVKSKKKITFWDPLSLIINEAKAGGPFDGLIPGGDNLTGEDAENLITSLDGFSASFEDLEAQLSQTNAGMDTANVNWAETNVQIGNANDNMAVTNENMAETNKVIDKNWNETNRQIGRANSVAEKMSDPKHMFKLAAATSAGAVFGATLANLAIDGVVGGAKWVYELITGTKEKAKRWENFRKAREKWEETLETAQKLEKLLDQFLKSQELMTQIKNSLTTDQKKNISREKLVSSLSVDNRRMKKRKKKLEKLFDETTSVRCEETVGKELDEVENLVSSQENLKLFLSEKQFAIYNTKMFCDSLSQIMGKLGEAEATLQTYRLHILDAREEWEETNEERQEKLTKIISRLNDEDTHDDFKDERISNAKEMYEQLEDAVTDRKNSWVSTCSKKHPKWDNFPNHDDTSDNDEIEEACEEDYKGTIGLHDKERLDRALIAKSKKIEMAKRDYKRSKNTPIELNTDAEDQRLISYYKWFSDLEQQQHCYTHKDEPKCAKQSKSKFMGPFYVKDRAKASLKDICNRDMYDY